jgi:hypothetical protein
MNLIEKIIARRVAGALIAAGKPVTVDYNDGEQPTLVGSMDVAAIIKAANEVDECYFLTDPLGDGTYDCFVRWIWGNGNEGLDCLSDYSTPLSREIDPIVALNWEVEAFAAIEALDAIVREQLFGGGTAESQQRVIDMCLNAERRFAIKREA